MKQDTLNCMARNLLILYKMAVLLIGDGFY